MSHSISLVSSTQSRVMTDCILTECDDSKMKSSEQSDDEDSINSLGHGLVVVVKEEEEEEEDCSICSSDQQDQRSKKTEEDSRCKTDEEEREKKKKKKNCDGVGRSKTNGWRSRDRRLRRRSSPDIVGCFLTSNNSTGSPTHTPSGGGGGGALSRGMMISSEDDQVRLAAQEETFDQMDPYLRSPPPPPPTMPSGAQSEGGGCGLASRQDCFVGHHQPIDGGPSSPTPPAAAAAARIKQQIEHDNTQARLAWLGYQQELHRDWGFWSSLSLSTLNIGTIPGAFFGLTTALSWGGPSVLVWGYLLGMLVMLCLCGVIAEIASAFPVAGAMMTWTFKLARSNSKLREWARFISWLTGSLLFFAHVVIQVALTSQSSIILSTISKLNPNLTIVSGWRIFLIDSTYLIICGILLSTEKLRSPKIWIGFGLISLISFLIILISLMIFSNSKSNLNQIFLKFDNHTDFKSNPFVFLMGSSLISLAFGAEATIHLAEETCEPSKNVPKAFFCSTLISYILGLAMNLCLSATLPPLTSKVPRLVDLIFSHCPKSISILIISCLLILMIFQDLAQLFAASRFTWAIARENAFPGSKLWRKVSGENRIPKMATILMVSCSIVTGAMINIKDSIFSHSLITSATYLVVVCYLTPLAIYLTCEKDVLDYDGRNVWTIRGLSRPCGWISVFSLTTVLSLMACPTGLPISTNTWSWSPLVLLTLTILSTFTWMTYGNQRYIGPIKSITFWTTGQELDLPPILRKHQPNNVELNKNQIKQNKIKLSDDHHHNKSDQSKPINNLKNDSNPQQQLNKKNINELNRNSLRFPYKNQQQSPEKQQDSQEEREEEEERRRRRIYNYFNNNDENDNCRNLTYNYNSFDLSVCARSNLMIRTTLSNRVLPINVTTTTFTQICSNSTDHIPT